MMAFILFILFIILLRVGELILSRRNEVWLLQNGAIEYGQKHYPYIVTLHVLFIVSLIIEYSITHTAEAVFFYNYHCALIYIQPPLCAACHGMFHSA